MEGFDMARINSSAHYKHTTREYLSNVHGYSWEAIVRTLQQEVVSDVLHSAFSSQNEFTGRAPAVQNIAGVVHTLKSEIRSATTHNMRYLDAILIRT